MKREIDINEISDGRRYSLNDMVKADCQDCVGCSDCCRGMGGSIVLDPLDVHRLMEGTGLAMEQLLEGYLELTVVDGVILPSLRLDGPGESCRFLTKEGRCGIHAFRPGICRLFPLGRLYENRNVSYFLQVKECSHKNRGKIKVKKWLGEPEAARYEAFILDWHYFLLDVEAAVERRQEDAFHRQITAYLLRLFYLTPYRKEDFYGQFYRRLKEAGSFSAAATGPADSEASLGRLTDPQDPRPASEE